MNRLAWQIAKLISSRFTAHRGLGRSFGKLVLAFDRQVTRLREQERVAKVYNKCYPYCEKFYGPQMSFDLLILLPTRVCRNESHMSLG